MSSGSSTRSIEAGALDESALEGALADAPLDPKRVVHLALGVAKLLQGLHERGEVCGTLNPSDLVLSSDGSVDLRRGAPPSRSGEVPFGALPYIAPERTGRTAHTVDHRCDLYSLGVILYQALAGRPPFRATDSAALIHAHLALEPAPLTTLEPSLPTILWDIVSHLLKKNPDDRYQSSKSVIDDLIRCAESLDGQGVIPPFEIDASERSARLEIPRRLYGRENELRRLGDYLERAAVGRSQFVLISGEAGVGKSSLVEAARSLWTQQNAVFITGKFNQIQNAPYEAWTRALEHLVDQLLASSSETLARTRKVMLDALGETALAVVQLAPELEAVLGPQPKMSPLPPKEAQQRLRAAVAALLHALNDVQTPLVLFLDDLHWADPASFTLLRDTLLHPESRGLCIVGAYRDGELPSDSALPGLIADVRATATTQVEQIELEPLSAPSVRQLVADTLRAERSAAEPVSEIVFAKTLGNPFFLGQLLRGIHTRGAIVFDAESKHWNWDVGALRSLDIADNVAAFTIERLRELPDGAQVILHTLACVGREAEVDLIARVCGVAVEELPAMLVGSIEAGTISLDRALPGRESAGSGREVLRFTHDRVQAAAYDLRSPEETARRHFAIGGVLLAGSEETISRATLFDAVNQLNRGKSSAGEGDFARLFSINQRAGRAARDAGAFSDALRYYETALSLMPADYWKTHPTDAATLYLNHSEVAYLAPDFDKMDRVLDEALGRVQDVVLRARLVAIRTRALNDQNRHDELTKLVLQTLRSLKVKLPQRPTMGHVLVALVGHRIRLGRATSEELRALPEGTDPADLAARELISSCLVSMYRRNLALYLLMVLALVKLTIKGGNSPITPFAYASYAVLLVSALGDADEANRFGDLAIELAEREAYRLYRPKTGAIVYNLIKHWRSPLRDCIEPLARVQREARVLGDPEYGGYAVVAQTFEMCMVGLPLEKVEETAKAFSDEFRAYPTTLYMNDVWREAVLNLLGRGNGDPMVLGGQTFFDESRAVHELTEMGDHTIVCGFHIIKTMLGVVFHRYDLALEHADLARRHLNGLAGAPHIPYFHFYEALAVLRGSPREGPGRSRALSRAAGIVAKLQKWATGAPANYAHRAQLAAAELARARGDHLAVLEHYDKAIELAGKHGFVHEEGLANEYASEYHAAQGRRQLARLYLTQAFVCYRTWGAKAKLDLLRRAHPWLEEEAERGLETGSRSVHLSDLDLASVLEASQALSQELNLEEFLGKLMATAVQSSGAQRAALVLAEGSELRMRARLDRPEQSVKLHDEPIELAPELPVSVVRYVHRSRRPLLLGAAATDARFAGDPHIKARHVASILSVPIISRNEARGVLYLESDVVDAFGAKRLRILEALSGQMAASLENAELYTRLEGALKAQIELTTAHERFVPHQFLKALGRQRITDVGVGDHTMKEMTVLYSDMRSFTGRIEKMLPTQSMEFINGYIRHVEAPIADQGGFIDSFAGDAILALFETGADATVRAGLGMLRALKDYNRERGLDDSQAIRIGIGVNTGTLILGTIGGQNRIKCGVVGDSVNLAARIEGLTKTYHAPFLIGDSTYERLTSRADFCIRVVDRVTVKGRATPVTVYEVFDEDPPDLRRRKLDSLELYNDAVTHYQARRWETALPLLMRCRAVIPEDEVLRGFAERCDAWLRGDLKKEWSVDEGWTTD